MYPIRSRESPTQKQLIQAKQPDADARQPNQVAEHKCRSIIMRHLCRCTNDRADEKDEPFDDRQTYSHDRLTRLMSMVISMGVEPTTFRLVDGCSTTELGD
jgi:hypothetical protein